MTAAVLTAISTVFAFLFFGSLIRVLTIRWLEPEKTRERLGSLLVWWIGLAIIAVVAGVGPLAGVVLFGLISLIGLVEYCRLVDRIVPEKTGRRALFFVVPLTYAAAWVDDDLLFALSTPVIGVFLIAATLVLSGKTKGYLAGTGSLAWGALIVVFFPAHAVRLLAVPPQTNPVGEAAGWFIYLIVLTECNDIFQALWGRRLGRTKITPQISPNKSLEGLIGGVLSTFVLAALIAPYLTPLAAPWSWSASGRDFQVPYAGVIIACLVVVVSGFVGDLNMSALKRDAGVKDTGALLPSQGGVLDRMDSLTFAAPMFYYFVRLLG